MRETPNRILEFLTAPAKPAGDACRSNRRRRSSVKVELSWLEGDLWRTVPGRLRDISRGGACVVARLIPLPGRPARLRFVEGEGSPWIEAQTLGAEVDAPRRSRVRLRFEEPCPGFFLRLAILDTAEPLDEAQAAANPWESCMKGVAE